MIDLEKLKAKIGYQTLLLAGFSLLASGLLGMADMATRDTIALRLEEDLRASLSEVIPAGSYSNNLLEDKVFVDSEGMLPGGEETLAYLAREEGKVVGVAFQLAASGGYTGPIQLIIGINSQGEILGVRVVSHAETPGLGDKIEISKADWILGFNGRSLENLSEKEWAVKKDGGVFDQFSGATITPRAVVNGVNLGLRFFDRHRAELLGSLEKGG